HPPRSRSRPYTTLFRSVLPPSGSTDKKGAGTPRFRPTMRVCRRELEGVADLDPDHPRAGAVGVGPSLVGVDRLVLVGDVLREQRSEEHTSELQSRENLV